MEFLFILTIFLFVVPLLIYGGRVLREERVEGGEVQPPLWSVKKGSHPIPQNQAFIGREEELATLRDLLKKKNVVIIEGEDGVGKTALAAQFASTLEEEKLFWYTCTEDTKAEELLVRLSAFLKEKGDISFEPIILNPELTIERKIKHSIKRLNKGNYTLIIDEAHKTQDPSIKEMFKAWIEGVRSSTILILARSGTFSLPQENVLKLKGMNEVDSLSLLKELGLELADEETLRKAYQIADGFPQYLKLFAGADGESRLSAICEKLRREGGSLRENLIKHCYNNLNSREESMLSQMSAFQEPFPLDACKWLKVRGNVERITSSLLHKGLLDSYQENAYLLPQSVKDFCYSNLKDKRETHKRIMKYYEDVKGSLEEEVGIELDFQRSYHAFQAGEFERAAEILLESAKRMISEGYSSSLLSALNKFDRANLQDATWIKICQLQASCYNYRRIFDEAMEKCREVLLIAREIGDSDALSSGYRNLALVHQTKGELTEAIKYYEMSLRIPREGGVERKGLSMYEEIWPVYMGKGRFNEAIRYYLDHAELPQPTEDGKNLIEEAATHINLGSVYEERRDYGRAIRHYLRSLELSTSCGDIIGEGISYTHLGKAFELQKNYDKAISYYEKAIEAKTKIGDRMGEMELYISLGTLHQARDEHPKALDYYQRALHLANQLRDVVGLSIVYTQLAAAAESRGDFEKAITYYENALKAKLDLEDEAGIASIYNALAKVYKDKGEPLRAIEYYEKAIDISGKTKDLELQAISCNNLGKIFEERGEFDKAIYYYEKGLELSRRIHDTRGEGESYRGLGVCYQAKGNWSRAISFFEKGLEIFKRMSDLPSLEQTYSSLSICHSKIGDLERAAFYSEREERVKDRILRLRARV